MSGRFMPSGAYVAPYGSTPASRVGRTKSSTTPKSVPEKTTVTKSKADSKPKHTITAVVQSIDSDSDEPSTCGEKQRKSSAQMQPKSSLKGLFSKLNVKDSKAEPSRKTSTSTTTSSSSTDSDRRYISATTGEVVRISDARDSLDSLSVLNGKERISPPSYLSSAPTRL